MKIDTDFLSRITDVIDQSVDGKGRADHEKNYLSAYAPNAIEFCTGVQYWNMPSIFHHVRQYQIIRDAFNLRCPICNDNSIEAKDCWGKGREYLESETLLVWSNADNDFKCPRCGNTQYGLYDDGLFNWWDTILIIAGMRSGKSFLAGHVGGYIEHCLRVLSARGGKHAVARYFGQASGEIFDISFAASTATQANQTCYAKWRSMRNNSPWIQRAVSYVQKLEKEQIGNTGLWQYKELDKEVSDGWLQVRFTSVASNSAGLAGRTRIWASIDELSRLSTSESKTSAQELMRVLNQSLKTVRGAVRRLSLPYFYGLMMNVTSPISNDDEAMMMWAKAQKGEIKKTFAWKGATWEFNPDFTRADFDEEYRKDPVGAERDFGANPPNAETPLFDNPLRFWSCVDYSRSPAVTFNTIHKTDVTGKQYVGSLVDQLMYNWKDPMYIFCDAGATFDSFAIVGAHAEFVEENHYEQPRFSTNNLMLPEEGGHVSRLKSSKDSPMSQGLVGGPFKYGYTQKPSMSGENIGRLVTVYDFCCRIVPTRDKEVYFNSLIDIIKAIKEKRKIVTVCFDQWQSISLIQAVRDLGIQSNKVSLKNSDFLSFVQEVYQGKVSFLPPNPMDNVSLSDTGALQYSVDEENMYAESVGLVELLRLERSADLMKVVAPKKGGRRGRGSDDVARCLVGANLLVKDAVVSKLDSGRRRELVKRLNATGANFEPKLFRPGGR